MPVVAVASELESAGVVLAVASVVSGVKAESAPSVLEAASGVVSSRVEAAVSSAGAVELSELSSAAELASADESLVAESIPGGGGASKSALRSIDIDSGSMSCAPIK